MKQAQLLTHFTSILRIKIAFFLLAFSFQLVNSQTKNEKEERVQFTSLPNKVQNLSQDLPDNCKRVKYYRETDNEKTSYEIKFKYEKQLYSIEFSDTGVLEDIEILTHLNKIEKSTRKKLKDYFHQNYSKHKFIKIQEQYIYHSDTTAQEFLKKVLNKKTNLEHNFEIIVAVKKNKQYQYVEYVFDGNGNYVSNRTLNPTSYEHVLY